MLIRRETGYHLLVWMNVIPEIPQAMAKFLNVRLQDVDLTSNIDELGETPFVKTLYASVIGFWAGGGPIEARGFLLCRAQQHGFKYTTAKKYDRKMGASG